MSDGAFRVKRRHLAYGLVAAAIGAACGGSGRSSEPDGGGSASGVRSGDASDTPVSYAPTFSAVYAEVFAAHSCLLGLCHGEGASAGGLNLVPRDRAHDSLLAPSRSRDCGELGLAAVEPGEPAASLLVVKLRADPPCGLEMPPDELVDPLHVAQVERWILRGAPDD